MAPPPLPQGFEVESRGGGYDPLAPLLSNGVEATNGYRTAQDIQRLKGKGYTPATNSDHLRGDAVDLVPGKSGWSLGRLEMEARKHFGADASVSVHNGTHVHVSLPNWGNAPGTPGTPRSGLPEIPGDFELEQRGALTGDYVSVPKVSRKEMMAAAAQVPERTLTGMQLEAIQSPVNRFTPAEEVERMNALVSPPPEKPDVPARVGIGPAIRAVSDAATGKEPQVVDTTGTIGGFFDELPTEVRHKLTADQLADYVDLAKSKPNAQQITDLFKGFGFDIHNADAIATALGKGALVNKAVAYRLPGQEENADGTTGSAVRGFFDPFNVLDETIGFTNTLGAGAGRDDLETVWNSDRPFGDILDSNIDRMRGVVASDERYHPYARIGGQLTSGLVVPYGAGARTTAQLAKLGAVEGGLAGFGAGEGDVVDRLPNAGVGAGFGAAGGALLAKTGQGLSNLYRSLVRRAGDDAEGIGGEIAAEAVPIINDGVQNAGPTPAARSQPQGGVTSAAMRMEDSAPELVGSVRERDYINVSPSGPDIPPGFVLDAPAMGRARPMGEPATAQEVAAAARKVQPEDVLPAKPLNEADALTTRTVPTQSGATVSQRGPIDLVGFLRSRGGVQDQGGELSHLGINNIARDEDFARAEGFMGKLVNPKGLSLDDAAEAAFDAGYFNERPSIPEFLDALHGTFQGTNRRFHPDDLNEVSAFGAVREQRLATEALGEQPRQVGNIDLGKLNSPKAIDEALKATDNAFGGTDAARRGRMSFEQTEALADDLGMTAEHLLSRRPGQALNAEEALAARRILAKSANELVNLAGKVRGGSDEEIAAFQRALLRHAGIQQQVAGATAEAGRALSQFRMIAKAGDHRGRVLTSLIEGQGGRTSIEDAAQAILDLQQVPGALNKFSRDVVKPTWKDKLVELWYNSLLSGPQTHAVNILSNTLTAGLQLPEHIAAAALGSARKGFATNLLRRKADEATDRVLLSEIGPRTTGLLQGAREGLQAFKHTLKTGDVPDFVTKVESARQEAIGGVAGKVVRTPTRLLSAEDEFFKATARRMQLSGLAVRKAKSEGLKGPALRARIAELTSDPTPEMIASATDYARYLTFQQPLGTAMQKVQGIVQEHPWLKLFVPFIRTPTNLLKFAVERSPAAPMLKEVRQAIKAGGASRDLAVARVALGTGMGLTVAQLVGDGIITGGGPADDNARRLMYADGWQPYSVKIGDTYYSYRRLDPLSTTLGVVADSIDLQSHMTDSQRQKVGALVVSSVLRNLENKTWLSGMSDLVAAIDDPQRFGKGFIERLAGSIAVPAMAAQTARVIDPVQRETSTEGFLAGILDSVRARIPYASKGLNPQRDVFGDEVTREGGVGPDIVSPLAKSAARNDRVIRELLDVGASIGRLSRDVKGRRLSDDEMDAYEQLAGRLTREYLSAEIDAPDWAMLEPATRLKAIDRAKKQARKDARDTLFGGGDDKKSAPALPPGFEVEQ